MGGQNLAVMCAECSGVQAGMSGIGGKMAGFDELSGLF